MDLSIDHLLTYVNEVSARKRALSGQEASLRRRETEIDRLQATIANENTKLDNANKALRRGRNDFNNKIASSFHAEIGPVTAALDKLRLQQTSGNETQDSLREQVSSTQAALTTAQCSVSSLEQKLSNLQNNVVSNEIAMTEYSKQVKAFEAKQLADSTQINDLSRELSEVKAKLSPSKELQRRMVSSKASDQEASSAACRTLREQRDSLQAQQRELSSENATIKGHVRSLEQRIEYQKDTEISLRNACEAAYQRAQKTDEANKAIAKNASAVETKLSALLEIAHTTLQCTNSNLEDRVALLDSLVEMKGINVQDLQRSIKKLQDHNRQLKEKAVELSHELQSTRAETIELAPTATTYQAPLTPSGEMRAEIETLKMKLCIAEEALQNTMSPRPRKKGRLGTGLRPAAPSMPKYPPPTPALRYGDNLSGSASVSSLSGVGTSHMRSPPTPSIINNLSTSASDSSLPVAGSSHTRPFQISSFHSSPSGSTTKISPSMTDISHPH